MQKKNLDVRKRIKETGVKHWELALKLNVHDTTLSRWLRVELDDNKKEEIYTAIDELAQEEATTVSAAQ